LKLANQYIIPFKGLAEGEHVFEFDLGKAFFDEHEIFDARNGLVDIKVSLIKRSQLLTLEIYMTGFMEIPCDRCLEYFPFPIELESNFIIKFSEVTEDNSDEIWVMHPNEHEINLGQYFYDCLAVEMPLQKFHPIGPDNLPGCNREMLNLIDKHTLSTNDQTEDVDPRWIGLKNLLNDNNN
jgi:uncharacterized protein